MNKKNIYTLIILLIITAVLTFVYFSICSKDANDFEIKTSSGEFMPVKICNHDFKIQRVMLNNIDVVQKIAEAVNSEYEMTLDKTQTNCYWVDQIYDSKIEDYNLNSTIFGDEENDYVVRIESIVDPVMYIGEGFLIDKETYEIYNMNALDSSRGFKIGKLK